MGAGHTLSTEQPIVTTKSASFTICGVSIFGWFVERSIPFLLHDLDNHRVDASCRYGSSAHCVYAPPSCESFGHLASPCVLNTDEQYLHFFKLDSLLDSGPRSFVRRVCIIIVQSRF